MQLHRRGGGTATALIVLAFIAGAVAGVLGAVLLIDDSGNDGAEATADFDNGTGVGDEITTTTADREEQATCVRVLGRAEEALDRVRAVADAVGELDADRLSAAIDELNREAERLASAVDACRDVIEG